MKLRALKSKFVWECHESTRRFLRLHRILLFTTLMSLSLLATNQALAFRVDVVPEIPGILKGGILRWNAAPHSVDGVERSLDGGLRYSIEGGSYEAFRDKFHWDGSPPSVADLQQAVEQAFAAWEAVDPATGLGTMVRFVPDFNTPVVIEEIPSMLAGNARLNRGAEIDIAGDSLGSFAARTHRMGDPDSDTVTLTSGVSEYSAVAISGVDIRIDNGPDSPWDLAGFQDGLSLAIGSALGLAPVDTYNDPIATKYYDDNFDSTSSATALETLTNSFADLIDPFDPNNSTALKQFEPCTGPHPLNPNLCVGDPGFDTPGVDILMEGISENELRSSPQNDDISGRQFLYPFVREPGDFNADKILTVEDVDLLLNESGQPDPRKWFDLTGDEVVNLADRSAWVDLRGTFIGDTDLDGQVNAGDLNALALNWQADNATSWGQGDFNGDGQVNASDLNDLALNWQSGVMQAASAVPEPSTIVLLLLLGSTVMLSGRRR